MYEEIVPVSVLSTGIKLNTTICSAKNDRINTNLDPREFLPSIGFYDLLVIIAIT
jgi:hypothetical protein